MGTTSKHLRRAFSPPLCRALGSTGLSAKTLVYCSEGSLRILPALNEPALLDAARPAYDQLVLFTPARRTWFLASPRNGCVRGRYRDHFHPRKGVIP